MFGEKKISSRAKFIVISSTYDPVFYVVLFCHETYEKVIW